MAQEQRISSVRQQQRGVTGSQGEMTASSDRVLASCSPRATAAYIDSEPVSEGVLLVKLRLKSSTLCVICAYAPTNDYPGAQEDAFFVELQSGIDIVAARNTLVLAIDCNAQVGAEDPQQWLVVCGSLL